ncbi:MAG TPA: DUF58 domain-containing protein [Acidimicrobiales bacterium]|nr:DUF58 domain-containing protein [Acidimicrobiales bacterium]
MRIGSALTRKGWALLGMAAAAATAGYLVGLVELYPFSAAALILVLSARAWVGTKSWDVRASRSIRPSRVPAGGEARVFISVRNYDSRRSPLITVRDSFSDGRIAATFAVAPLESGEPRSAQYRLPARRRGMLEFRPLEIELCDPFGLAKVVRVAAPAASLTVHPRVDLLPRSSIPSDSERDQRAAAPLLGRGGDEFYALREYQIGDDLRQVHWISTARTDELMIRQPQNLWLGRTTVVVDARQSVHDRQSFEETLSAAASLAVSGLRGGMQVRVVVAGGQEARGGRGPGYEGTVLDTLAIASPTSGGSLAAEIRAAWTRGPVVVVTTDAAPAADLSAAARSAGGSESLIVVIERRGGGLTNAGDVFTSVQSASGRHSRVVRVPAGGSLVDALTGREAKTVVSGSC